MQKDILKILRYFSFFSYAPTGEEIFRFFPKKITGHGLEKNLKALEKKRRIVSLMKGSSSTSYTLLEYRVFFTHRSVRERISKKKVQRVRFFIRLLSWIPLIRFVALTGTVAVGNAQSKDDIDLFIIMSRNRLWSGRFISLYLASMLRIRRSRGERQVKDKVCLNLFFDERELKIPKQKHTLYVAHEVLQMKPLIDKENIFTRLLGANTWIFKMFPNAQESLKSNVQSSKSTNSKEYAIGGATRGDPMSAQSKVCPSTYWGCGAAESIAFPSKQNLIGNFVEIVLKRIQLYFINKHKTKERITDTQLWFFPEDFEEKIMREML